MKRCAEWVHLVDLNGAFAGEPKNLEQIVKIRENCNVKLELGGGIRDEETIKRYLDLGIDRVILGSIAVKDANFVKEIRKAGVLEQDALRKYIVIEKPIEIRHEGKIAGVYPDRVPRVTYIIDFEHNAIGYQEVKMELTPESYCREIAMARTFGFISDVEYLKSLGLIRGGSLENAVVLDSSGIVNNHLRFPNEFVRHKLLDCIGDFSLLGMPILAHIFTNKSGHAFNHAFLESFFKNKASWQTQTLNEPAGLSAKTAKSLAI